MGLINFFAEQLKQKDWLAFGTLHFDDNYVIAVFNTRGYVAYSPSQNVFFNYTPSDSTETESIEGKFVVHDPDHSGMQQMITMISGEQLFHFDAAQYCHYRFYWDAQEKTPYPKIPSRADIMAMTPKVTENKRDTLYNGADYEVELLDGSKQSVIDLYPDFKDELTHGEFSGARIYYWQRFYKNQQKFRDLIAGQFGVTDCI